MQQKSEHSRGATAKDARRRGTVNLGFIALVVACGAALAGAGAIQQREPTPSADAQTRESPVRLSHIRDGSPPKVYY